MKHSNKTIEVFLDSNIFYQNSFFETPGGSWLKKLSLAKKINIILPKIVESEVRSHMEKNRDSALDIINSFLNIITKSKISNEVLALEIEKYKEKYILEMNKKINSFFDNNLFEKDDNLRSHVESVFQDYFRGEGAFSEMKKRDDIPDAFIVHSLKNRKNVYCITHDKGLRKKLSAYEDLILFDSVSEFLETDIIKKYIEDFELEERNRSRKLILDNSFFDAYFKNGSASGSLVDKISRKLKYRAYPANGRAFPYKDFHIISINEIRIPDFKKFKTHYLPDDTLQLMFRISVDCVVGSIGIFPDMSDPSTLEVGLTGYRRGNLTNMEGLEMLITAHFTDSRNGFPYPMLYDSYVNGNYVNAGGYFVPIFNRDVYESHRQSFLENLRVIECEVL